MPPRPSINSHELHDILREREANFATACLRTHISRVERCLEEVMLIRNRAVTHETTNTSDNLLARVGFKHERHLSRQGEGEIRPTTRGVQTAVTWFSTRSFRQVTKNFFIRPCEVVRDIFGPARPIWHRLNGDTVQHWLVDLCCTCTNIR